MSRRVSLHDRDDAAGITDASTAKTGSAVEALIAPAVVAGEQSIVHIPCGKIMPHPRNRKILDDDVADLVAEFKAGVPILNALGVTAAADWNVGKPDELKPIQSDEFIITAGGHRRLRAAELAGLKTVPCVVRSTFAGADGRRAALLENLHRQDLDVFEEAEAFAELVAEPYKMSQRELSTIVFGKVNQQSHISKRLKLLKLPSTVRERVRLGQLHIADALELAGVVDNKPVFEDALRRMEQWRMPAKNAVATAQREYDMKVTRQRKIDGVRTAGGRTIDRAPAYYVQSKNEPTRLEQLKLKVDKHAAEPCHCFYVEDDGSSVQPVCEKPANHLPDGKSRLKLPKAVQERMTSRRTTDPDAVEQRQRRQIRKAQPARVAAARSMLVPLSLDEKTAQHLLDRALFGHVFNRNSSANDVAKIVIELLGLEGPRSGGPWPATFVEELMDKARADKDATVDVDVLVVVTAAAYFEGRLRTSYTAWGADEQWWLQLLTDRTDYEPCEAEHEKLAKIKAPKADVQECRVCHGKRLDNGVTWVAPDLCSACSDAEQAGWVAPGYVDGVSPELQDALRDGTALKAEIDAEAPAPCPACNGTGYDPEVGDNDTLCTRCQGEGAVETDELEAVSA